VTDDELIARWKAVLPGTGCGCPLCTRDLMDEMATRFREVIGVLIQKGSYYRKLWIDDVMKEAAYPSA
jgi:hypothetical protein